MEQLNRIELRGAVGIVRLQNTGEKVGARFTLATNHAYRDKDGTPVIETNWINVNAWEGRNVKDLALLQKGSKVHVIGRLRIQKYTGVDGTERTSPEVLATQLDIIDDSVNLECSF